MFFNEYEYIGHRVDTAYGYGEVVDVTSEEDDENPELVIILDSGDEVTLPSDAVDIVDDDEVDEDDDDEIEDDIEFDETEFGDEFERENE
jgi:hypothetical protein